MKKILMILSLFFSACDFKNIEMIEPNQKTSIEVLEEQSNEESEKPKAEVKKEEVKEEVKKEIVPSFKYEIGDCKPSVIQKESTFVVKFSDASCPKWMKIQTSDGRGHAIPIKIKLGHDYVLKVLKGFELAINLSNEQSGPYEKYLTLSNKGDKK